MSQTSTPLAASLVRRIRLLGPMSVAEFMAEALTNPAHGYYRHRNALGAAGDFTTAPEISQTFGELIGAWLADRWLALGSPPLVRLVELGPGSGALMADAWRVLAKVPGATQAMRLHLVEIDPALRARQQATLATANPTWCERFEDVPDDAPLLLVANEFFDALPIRQLVKTPGGWRERMVGLDPTREEPTLCFALAPGPSPWASAIAPGVRDAAENAVAEISPAATTLAAAIAGRLARDRGAALIVDYGSDGEPGATLQAVRKHRKVDVLDSPGESDLSAHVDFAALARAASANGVRAFGPVAQGDFLRALGIEARRDALLAAARTPAQRDAVASGVARLIDPGQMGTLFKAMALVDASSPPPPGFAPTE